MDIGLVTAQFKLCLIIHEPTRCLTPPSLSTVTKTNLSVHEDKYRVPYVKVSHRHCGLILFDIGPQNYRLLHACKGRADSID